MSIPFISLDSSWQDANKAVLPATLAAWVLEPASLTARLKQHCSEFRVQVLQERPVALPNFLQPLLPNTKQAQVREVILWCDNQPCVYAQSWLPEQTINTLRPLASLGERPLGEYIFQHQSLRRGPIEATTLAIEFAQLNLASTCYVRRSVFQLENQPLLVAEAFLPAMANLARLVR
ncbi:chorismate lyase [Rheinheimera metallidurans]|uniref:chorismate--pyruvate lyase family protein n=1 Tax=Rheinheimera sp. D18 TaxID=2545632 RepID=UPI00104A521B|nr:chorismate lyase [Rheinheimera sp. D18]QBL08547.1 chorismate lyase [Rheinheimera sp. D18]